MLAWSDPKGALSLIAIMTAAQSLGYYNLKRSVRGSMVAVFLKCEIYIMSYLCRRKR